MSPGLFHEALHALEPASLPVSVGDDVDRHAARALTAAAPSNAEVLDACKTAYAAHAEAVDALTYGSVDASQAPELASNVSALHTNDWGAQVPAPSLGSPIYSSAQMAGARRAVGADGAFLTFFVGIEVNAGVIVGGCGGVGVGLPFPWTDGAGPLWLAYGGLRIALNIDIAINLNAGVFLEPPSEVAGDYLGIELSAEPIAEGPSIGFGIHLSRDLSKIRGFSISVGIELGLLPFTAAVVFGTIATAQARPDALSNGLRGRSTRPTPGIERSGVVL